MEYRQIDLLCSKLNGSTYWNPPKMFHLVNDPSAASAFMNSFSELFSESSTVSQQWLSTPGGKFNGKVHYREDLGIWAYIDKKIYINRHSLWFGAGEPSWRPAIEINVPSTRSLHSSGQLAHDEDGRVHLIHRGGLGGGKYSVGAEIFAGLIQGFERDEVADGKIPRKYFVLGHANDQATLKTLSLYVREAVRIRELRENEFAYVSAVKNVQGSYLGDGLLGAKLTPENQKAASYLLNKTVAVEKLHAKVHDRLVSLLKGKNIKVANSRLDGGIGPDLYTLDDSGAMKALYEIKIGTDSQSIFTAIGQIIVYSENSRRPIKKFLVTKGIPASSLFKKALKRYGIEVLYYRIDGDEIIFQGL